MASSLDPLIGRHLILVFVEPWDLVSVVGDAPCGATIDDVDVRSDCLLVHMDSPFMIGALECRRFHIAPRHEGEHVSTLITSRSIRGNAFRVSMAASDCPKAAREMQAWRGGGVLAVVDVTLA